MLSVVITHLDCGSETAQSPNPNWSRSWSWSWTGWTGQTAAHGGRAGGGEKTKTAFQSRQTEWTRDRSATATRSQASPDTRREGRRGSRPLAALARVRGRGPAHTPEDLPRPRPGPAHPVRTRAAMALPLPLRNFDRILEVPGGARCTSAPCAWAARPSVAEELAGAREPQGQEGGRARLLALPSSPRSPSQGGVITRSCLPARAAVSRPVPCGNASVCVHLTSS